jgi:hypothetical protein
MNSHDAVFSTAVSYEAADCELFLRSLRKFSDANVFIFSDRDIRFPPEMGKVTVLSPARDAGIFEGAPALRSPNNSRYFWYRNLLKREGGRLERLLFADLRDVVFQGDPFSLLQDSNLLVAAEPVTLGNCPSNSHWFSSVYGQDELCRFASQPVICSGTTLGRVAAAEHYLSCMCQDLSLHGPRLDAGHTKLIIDQAIHSRYCYVHPSRITIHSHDNGGGIATLHHARQALFDRQGCLLNNEGTPFCILHQYDRFRQIRTIVKDNLYHHTKYDVETSVRDFLSTWAVGKTKSLLRAVWFGISRPHPPNSTRPPASGVAKPDRQG